MADFDIALQKEWLCMLDSYVIALSSELEKPIMEFPDSGDLMKSRSTNFHLVAENIAKYEYFLTSEASKLSELMVKRLQARIFLQKATKSIGLMQIKPFADSLNFYIARLTDLENILRTRAEQMRECVTALRSIKANTNG